MSVYVDELVDHGLGAVPEVPRARYWCHLFADTEAELHAFAARIGMRRSWFQDHGSVKHYDLTQSRRRLAVAAGAIERSAFDFLRARRAATS